MTESAIKLIVGLGNPELRYQDTRHNLGFWFIDRLTDLHGVNLTYESKFLGDVGKLMIGISELRLLKPNTYVNRSGQSISALAKYFAIPTSKILLIHDELDLAVGKVRLKYGGGHAGHNGIRDTIKALGTQDFWRLRVGIDKPVHKDRMLDYVLGRPSASDSIAIGYAIDISIAHLPHIVAGDFNQVMNELHRT